MHFSTIDKLKPKAIYLREGRHTWIKLDNSTIHKNHHCPAEVNISEPTNIIFETAGTPEEFNPHEKVLVLIE